MNTMTEQGNLVFKLAKLAYLACDDEDRDFYLMFNVMSMSIHDCCFDAIEIMKSYTKKSNDKLGDKTPSKDPPKYKQYYQYMLTMAEECGHGICMTIAKQQIKKFSERPLQEDVYPPLSPFESLDFETQFQMD